jgi:uncharacterized protein YbaR (Trm112 family)
MRPDLLAALRCPRCRSDLVLEAQRLRCSGCHAAHPIVDDIPVLLPDDVPNADEVELRRRVTLEAEDDLDELERRYAVHHFAALFELDLRRRLAGAAGGRVLDLGVGWGVAYLPVARELELWGLDFSLESLVLLKRLYERRGLPVPRLVCASVTAIPLAGARFDLIRSTQVLQHLPETASVDAAMVDAAELLAPGGQLVVDNLSWSYARWAGELLARLRPGRGRPRRAAWGAHYWLRHWDGDDARRALGPLGERVEVRYTETLFHPDVGLAPRSAAVARLDAALSRTPLAPLLARQLTADVRAPLTRRPAPDPPRGSS